MIDRYDYEMTARYQRQIQLRDIGIDGQNKLKQSHVLVVGAGGLASPALQYLVGAGVSHITLIDGDQVSLSNLHRQTLYRESQIGNYKALMAAEMLRELNSNCQITAITQKLTPANADQLIKTADLVLDCADSFAVSYILSDACLAHGKPLISASALEYSGYVGGFCGGAPSLRALFPDLPTKAATCATSGILGSVVGTIGALQAQMALSVILDLAPSPLGQLVNVDLMRFRFSSFRFDNATEPTKNLLKFISTNDINPKDFIVELRDMIEAPQAITQGAIRYNVDDFKQKIPKPQSGQRVVLCCHSGLRSWRAARHLQTYWDEEILLITQTTQT